jgi:hypothetical protein
MTPESLEEGIIGCKESEGKTNQIATLLKIVSMIASLGILPILGLIIKTIIRCSYDFHYLHPLMATDLPPVVPDQEDELTAEEIQDLTTLETEVFLPPTDPAVFDPAADIAAIHQRQIEGLVELEQIDQIIIDLDSAEGPQFNDLCNRLNMINHVTRDVIVEHFKNKRTIIALAEGWACPPVDDVLEYYSLNGPTVGANSQIKNQIRGLQGRALAEGLSELLKWETQRNISMQREEIDREHEQADLDEVLEASMAAIEPTVNLFDPSFDVPIAPEPADEVPVPVTLTAASDPVSPPKPQLTHEQMRDRRIQHLSRGALGRGVSSKAVDTSASSSALARRPSQPAIRGRMQVNPGIATPAVRSPIVHETFAERLAGMSDAEIINVSRAGDTIRRSPLPAKIYRQVNPWMAEPVRSQNSDNSFIEKLARISNAEIMDIPHAEWLAHAGVMAGEETLAVQVLNSGEDQSPEMIERQKKIELCLKVFNAIPRDVILAHYGLNESDVEGRLNNATGLDLIALIKELHKRK